ncbi:hypothetical protein AB0H58_29170 [Nocardia neocaledoniensis]|uniref:hypothetical protein n=1 Tax=Nocardia neocaledoniensis TaxID=236511 RepID=UPI0033D327C0
MAVPRRQAAYDPSGYRRWTNSLTPSGADSGANSPPAPRIHDVNGMTAASAARAYERLLGVRNMTGRANDDVQSAQPINGPGPIKVDFIDGPLPSQPPPAGANDHQSKLAAEQEKRQQAREREQQKPSAPAVEQPPAEVPGNQTPPPIATQPPQGSPAPTVPVEEHDPLLDAKGPNQDALPMPSTDGREVGKTWTEVRPNGQVVEYTIPEGNGKNTVDAVVKDAAGNVLSTARIVSIEGTANYIRWQDDVGGGSSYFESGGPNGLGYGQHFAPGTSTSGVPTHAFETSPDASQSRTLSLDSAGRVVGVDIGVRNSHGLYDNIHVDNFGNATMSSTKLGPGGELQSKFTGQMFANRSGWMIDELDNHWEGEPDKDGNQAWFRVQNGHTYRMNHLGVITDFSLDKDGRPRLDTIFPDGSQTVKSGRATVHFDANGKEVWKNEIPAPVQPWDVRAWEGTKRGLIGLASVVSDTVGAPFHMMQDGVRGMSSIRVDQYGTFHVAYDAPNRFANAGTAVVGLAKGAAMFYLALPKYAALTSYDALRGSDFVRGSSSYEPPDRKDELVKDFTGIPLKQWKDDTVGSAFEFGSATVGGLVLFRSVGIRPRLVPTGLLEISSGLRRQATGYMYARTKSTLTMASGLASRAARHGSGQVDRLREWGNQPAKSMEIISDLIAEFWNGPPPGFQLAGGYYYSTRTSFAGQKVNLPWLAGPFTMFAKRGFGRQSGSQSGPGARTNSGTRRPVPAIPKAAKLTGPPGRAVRPEQLREPLSTGKTVDGETYLVDENGVPHVLTDKWDNDNSRLGLKLLNDELKSRGVYLGDPGGTGVKYYLQNDTAALSTKGFINGTVAGGTADIVRVTWRNGAVVSIKSVDVTGTGRERSSGLGTSKQEISEHAGTIFNKLPGGSKFQTQNVMFFAYSREQALLLAEIFKTRYEVRIVHSGTRFDSRPHGWP